MLLTCGGLLLQTLSAPAAPDLGIRSEKLLTFETPLFRYKDFDRRVAFVNAELEKVRAIPGVSTPDRSSNSVYRRRPRDVLSAGGPVRRPGLPDRSR